MNSQLRRISDASGKYLYDALEFLCPGCQEIGGSGLHLLPVTPCEGRPSWTWDGNLEAPTVSPSILTRYNDGVCHSFLRAGVFEFLGDCTHSLAGQKVPMLDLGEWAR